MEIVPVTEENLLQAAFVHAESWRESHREICSPEFVAAHTTERQTDYLRQEMERGKRVFLLMDPEPAAVVSIQGDVIENLYVLPQKQRMGYGSGLLRFAMEQCETPRLWILSTNQSAKAFYEANGFSLSGNAKQLKGGLKELEMKK